MIESSKIKRICQIILQGDSPQIKEEDLRNLIQSESFEELMVQVASQLKQIGFSLIRTNFLGEKYYVLTTPGKDEKISPIMYGILGSLVALYNELGTTISKKDLKNIYRDVWNECNLLIENGYLAIVEEDGIKKVLITPIAKGVCKDLLKNFNLKEILQLLEN